MNLPHFLDQSQYVEKKAYMRRLWQGHIRGALAYNSIMLGPDAARSYEAKSDHIGEQFQQQCLEGLGQRAWDQDLINVGALRR